MVLMIAPLRCSAILGAAAGHVWKTVHKCVSSSAAKSAVVTFRIDEPGGSGMPAQLTRMSIRPNSRTQLSISASAASSSTSVGEHDSRRLLRR
jgi:hypothetical protein